ncbi:alpha/beta hydrolase family protein [Cognatilysobacter lacus]|uniref:Alpha/beta fold hydrolase n=1 Tax=Cognatilysobacter lacus TaxID=1643323 RepID=A0A5D8Z7C2_9GAMM|nr:alpha/beta fold hydrolase [Lysobacter lacus]TZF90580.1 alpha/beta fold hydrolase [Lysobacter lacus]
MSVQARWLPCGSDDGHRWQVLTVSGDRIDRVLVWLPALGVPARTYETFATALAERGVAVVVHEWRGFGSSSWRASRTNDWAYRELLMSDIPATRDCALREFGRIDVIGGHSLGGQLATCSLALSPASIGELWLVASGSPFWRAFPTRVAIWLPAAYRVLDTLARWFGALPGRRIGFGGTEARSVIRDWSRTGLTGHYAAPGVGDIESSLRQLRVPVRAVLAARDWLAPRSSLDYLLGKTNSTDVRVALVDAATLGAPADHFAWMRSPAAVVDALLPDRYHEGSNIPGNAP